MEHLLLRQHIERFVSLTEEEWSALAQNLSISKIPRKGAFSKEGEMEDKIALVLKGSFRQFYTKDGEEKTTYFYFENHLMSSYISILQNQPSLLTIEALEDSEVLCFSAQTLQNLYTNYPVYQIFGRKLAEYLAVGLEIRMVSLLMDSPEERYIGLLKSNKKKILERIPQHYIASYLGITPVSLSRIRNRIIAAERI
ncbi:Crp/Fnr family transcriptional regulator [Cytophagaceae bacterium DM2B3-1]|uniref:Crp/Fnr family transcriptional regulator n=1 Tax=Xanthocytophaga flava TaxID=3048013 RepID=A0AAE3U9D7_9BACT|nr:Crp/Fnr family transcriptional regulator [Xanthocytophaga flavus]MDJ1470600.1 Crp/Fnr family transcriptional regulator [Xanthocytophaga flavus]MDJ1481594.1 Crp/Fnr family transcriptional regulator [Xanthocytophaga flavus]MDJ1491557.1 Crp/Fnr family transcriptional regulator [Xanthocytophaga flavus]